MCQYEFVNLFLKYPLILGYVLVESTQNFSI